MNKVTIESVEWHRDQLFKLLQGDEDLIKMSEDIHLVKADLGDIIEKAKSKKKVRVKQTSTRKAHYRDQTVGSDKVSEPGEGAKADGAKAVTVDSMKSMVSNLGLGESQGMGDRGVQVYHDILRKVIDVKMNYGFADKEDTKSRTENSNKIKAALDGAGISYETKTDVIMPGQINFTIPM